MKNKPVVIFKTIMSIGLIDIILTHVNISQTWKQFQSLSLPFVFFALIYYTGCQWLSCLRWQVVLRSSGYSMPISNLLSSYFAGMFLNIFLPGSFGGDAYRVYRVAKQTKDSEAALVSVFLERFTGLFALSALAIVGLPPAVKIVGRWDIILLFFGCVGALVGGVILIISPRLLMIIEPWLQKLCLQSLAARFAKIQILLRQFARHPQALILSTLLSFLLMLGIVYYHYLVAQQLKIQISYLELLVFIPIVAVITLLPISLGGMGVKEGLWVYLFTRIGLTGEQALLLSVTTTILGWLLALPGGIVILLDSAGFQDIKRVDDMKRSLFLKIYPFLLKKRSFFFKIGTPLLQICSLWYCGSQVFCPCCEGQFRKFLPFGVQRRPNAICPRCLSLERHRLLWLYLKSKTNLLSSSLQVLHIAPEYLLKKSISDLPNISYLSADLQLHEAMVQMDITDIQYEDNIFDAILCSHVLEHVPNDAKAMQELCRVLKPGGWAILHVPLDPKLEQTLEGSSDLSPKERERLFGHHDHVRMYGSDYKGKLEQAGFTVKVHSYAQELGNDKCKKFGLMTDEDIYFCTKL
ncbi:MAG: flippase-like domain-containing protein [Chroococcidiopsidaceae cyanobacterium CP_BM_ER_R8_30]|nr:flippase-like domain-containing protein [Chroococcidiopsidaceae cyanobacterium CP_BM_ER_R8_30]